MPKRKTARYSVAFSVLIIILALIMGFVVGFCAYAYATLPKDKGDVAPGVDFAAYFLELGNDYNGDCIYIKAGETDILIDGGSRADSAGAISSFINEYVTDNVLEYVIVTHADQDHIAAFAGNNAAKSLFELYECKTIIDFALTNKTTAVYNRYVSQRDAEVSGGAKHFTALQCVREEDGASKRYELGAEMSMTILNQKYYRENSPDENNYSVCVLFTQGDKNFLFTGDLEKDGEISLVESNALPEVELFKAGHHGSKTSSNDALLSVIRPKIVCVSCVAGSTEYTSNAENTFPTQAFIDRVAKYTEQVFVTSMWDNGSCVSFNGAVSVVSDGNGITVKGSASSVPLKDTEWLKNNRSVPEEWRKAA